MTTTDENPAAELELDLLAWNLPAPRREERRDAGNGPRPWPPWPFKPIFEEDESRPEESEVDS